jgi:hypothetical protein
MKLLIASATIVGLALTAGDGRAETEVLAKAGAWQAFGGTTTDGHPVCGMSSSGAGRYFGVKYFAGDDTITIQLGSDKWTLKNNVKVKVEMQFDKASPWAANATGMHFGDGDAGLQFDINRKQLDQFVQEFRDSNAITVRFPNDDVSDWHGSLEGTEVVSNNFISCIRKLR